MSIHPIRTFQHFLRDAQGGRYQPGRDPREHSPLIGKQIRMGNQAIQASLPPDSTLGLLAYMLMGGMPEGAFGREAGLARGVGRPVPRALGVVGHAPHRDEYANLRGIARIGHSVKAPPRPSLPGPSVIPGDSIRPRGSVIPGGSIDPGGSTQPNSSWASRLIHDESGMASLGPFLERPKPSLGKQGYETGSSPFANWVNGGHPGVLSGGPQSPGLKASAPRTGKAVMAHSIPEKRPPVEGYGLGRRPNLDRLAGAEMQRSVRGPGNITGGQMARRTAVGTTGTALGVLGAALLGQQLDKGGARARAHRVQKERQHYGLH